MRIDLLQFRRNTAAGAAESNPTLDEGEPGFETDTGRTKIGDGSTAWNDLRYQDEPEGLAGVLYWGKYNDVLTIPADAAWHTVTTYDENYIATQYTSEVASDVSFDPATGIATVVTTGLYTCAFYFNIDDHTPSSSRARLHFVAPSGTEYSGYDEFRPVLGDEGATSGGASGTTTQRLKAGTTVRVQGAVISGGDAYGVDYAEIYMQRVG